MVLPLEEAIINLKDGDGFFSINFFFAGLAFSPLLTGLIGCANVQADLDDKRYIFWRSKPIGAKSFIGIKFIVGLIIAMLVPAIVTAFGVVSSKMCGEKVLYRDVIVIISLLGLMGVMAYSLCFFSNVLVRKIARGWLIGIVAGCFILVLPFMLPLDYKDVMTDMLLFDSPLYWGMMIIVSIAAFVLSLFAADHDWHLKTNLKGLLWCGAGLVFLLAMLFSSQVANIKVKHEQEIPQEPHRGEINIIDGKIMSGWNHYMNIDGNGFTFDQIESKEPVDMVWPISEIDEGYKMNRRLPYKIFKSGDDLYTFDMLWYYREIEEDGHKVKQYEKLYLGSSKRFKNAWVGLSYIDISDCLEGTDRKSLSRVIIREADDKLVAIVGNSWVVADVRDVENIKLLDKQIDKYKPFGTYESMGKDNVRIPKLPVEGISDETRIRLSIDVYNQWSKWYYHNRGLSTVEISDGRISTFDVNRKAIGRYDVYKTDEKYIYCRLGAMRPFTVLERIGGLYFINGFFIKNSKMYLETGMGGLMVFDISSSDRIRKIGYFVRFGCEFEDIEILDNGDILMCLSTMVETGEVDKHGSSQRRKLYLCLLENPADN
jgi:hypothetical protein